MKMEEIDCSDMSAQKFRCRGIMQKKEYNIKVAIFMGIDTMVYLESLR